MTLKWNTERNRMGGAAGADRTRMPARRSKGTTMGNATRGAIFGYALAVGLVCSGNALAQTSATRSSSFAYDVASGLLTQEVVEPGTPALRLQTDYVYDAYGNKTQVSASGVDIATRTTTTTYDGQGRFVTTVTNSLNQSETWQYDPKFGKPTRQTGPNGLTTTWSYDTFGRKILEVRPDGTQTRWTYAFCLGTNGGTINCGLAGSKYIVYATPLAADGVTQNGPVNIVYFDTLDREIERDTQGFDSSTISVAKQYDSLGRVLKQSRPYFVRPATPAWTTFTYDALGRVVTKTDPDSSVTSTPITASSPATTNGLSQTVTTTKNSQGQTSPSPTRRARPPATATTRSATRSGPPTRSATSSPTPTTCAAARSRSSDPDLGTWSYAYNTPTSSSARPTPRARSRP